MSLSRRHLLPGLALMPGLAAPAAAASLRAGQLPRLVREAIGGDGILSLPAGRFATETLTIDGGLTLTGIPGRTWLVPKLGKSVLRINGRAPVTLQGIGFDGEQQGGNEPLVHAEDAGDLTVTGCRFANTPDTALHLERCAGNVTSSRFSRIGLTGIFTRDGKGLALSGNTLTDIGNNAIQVWTSEPAEDGTIVSNNRIARVDYTNGGTGQNGNGVIIFRAGSVVVEGNHISDCAFTGVRNNSGRNCHIVNNNLSRFGEVAIYCEFAFEGAVVTGNIIEDTGLGISITNFDYKGRLATVANNVVRRCKGPGVLKETSGTGIHCEGDATVTGNVVEDARDAGISLGWGPHSRTLMATGNIVRDARIGIRFSTTRNADTVMIANNRISGSREMAIAGFDHWDATTGDLSANGADIPAGVLVKDNLVN